MATCGDYSAICFRAASRAGRSTRGKPSSIRAQSSRLSPGARLTIGKRISERFYLTFAQLLTSEQRDQLILLEFTQSDRLSWIVSQNEDATYAIDVRVRHIF